MNKILGYYDDNGNECFQNPETMTYVQLELCGNHSEGKSCLVSKDSLSFVLKYKWYLGKDGYPITHGTIDRRRQFGRGRKMHKLIMPKINKGYVIDHINRDKLDNRLFNLRICTQKENSYNTSRKSNKYKGVRKIGNKYKAAISKDGKNYEIGSINDEQTAAKIYDLMAEELFGDYAGKNFG